MAANKAVELIVSGEVQGVGYRGFVTRIARKLKLVGFAENLEDGTVRIQCKGEAASVDKFKELIDVKNPVQASLIEVDGITEKVIEPEKVAGTGFKEKLGEPGDELSQGFATGNAYLSFVAQSLGNKIDGLGNSLGNKIDGLGNSLGNKIDSGFGKMDKNFERLEGKTEQFRTDSNTNFQVLGDKYGKISNTMEKIDKNIETIAKKKHGIFD